MELPKVSVIVPVYNAEKTLHKCLDSLTNQTLKDWELILVDDGSSDSSGKICDNYARNDKRIHVIHKQNGGVSSARQAGLKACTGKYIIHTDPDDWVEPGMLEELYNKAVTDDADMVICDFYSDYIDTSHYILQCPTSLDNSNILNDMFESQKVHGSCCNKLVNRACIEKYNIAFPVDVNYCEDVCFNAQLLKHDIKISYIHKAFYHYVQHLSSITNNYTIETFEQQKKYLNFLTNHFNENSLPIARTKELIKKYAFRNVIINNKELEMLYPEIKHVHNEKLVTAVMYNLAFSGHPFLASCLRFLYGRVH